MSYLIEVDRSSAIHEITLASDTSYTSGGTIALDGVASSHATGRVSLSSNVVTLAPGEYIINGSIAIDRTDTTTDYAIDFYDDSDSSLLPIDEGWMGSRSVTASTSSSLVLQAQVSLTSSVSFYLQGTGSAGTQKALGTSLIILEL